MLSGVSAQGACPTMRLRFVSRVESAFSAAEKLKIHLNLPLFGVSAQKTAFF